MSVLDNFSRRAGTTLRSGEWVDSGAKLLREKVVPGMPADLRDDAGKVLTRLQDLKTKSALGRVSSSVFTSIVAYFGMGMESEAKLLYLREVASNKERQDVLDAATDSALDSHRDVEDAWDEVKAAAEDVLEVAGPLAISMLLAL